MDVVKVLESRYSTKQFDATKKIDAETLEKVKTLLQKSPSSTNIQPWHFVIATTEEGKKRVTKATQGFFSFNESKVLEASATIVFATRIAASEDYLNHVLDKEETDGRFAQPEHKTQNHAARSIFANMHLQQMKDQQHWMEKQVYLNLGNFLLGAAALGLDALPMEGCDMNVLNEEFDLIKKGYTASFIVSIGYHAETDFNAALPKSRLDMNEIIELV